MQNSHFTAHVKITETFPAVTDDYGKLKSDRKVTDVTEFTPSARTATKNS